MVLLLSIAAAANPATVVATPSLPLGPHPRIWLSVAARAALHTNVARTDSAAAAVVAACRRVTDEPAAFATSGSQGDGWAFPASACALAFQITGDPAFAEAGVRLWRALLEDVERQGDRQACIDGASPTRAVVSIARDGGSAIRFVGVHTALLYDWLHDAPGADDQLRQQTRDCFRAWLGWFAQMGELTTQPGTSTQAGFLAAKTLISVAASGDGDAVLDRGLSEVVDDGFGKQLVGDGLDSPPRAPTPGERHGVLVGGDWPEGWQYGSLGVLEYAFAARALEEQGVPLAALHGWTRDLVVRYIHGLTPARDGMYAGGDTQAATAHLPLQPRPLLAAILGPSSDEIAGWAADLRARLPPAQDAAPIFDALGEARGAQRYDYLAGTARPTFYFAPGTRNLYVRGAWSDDTSWAVFTCAPRQVDDHQHADASSFVLSRGADPLIVDPSPFGSRSSLTGNAVAVDSDLGDDDQGDGHPSQTPASEAELRWLRATGSGVVAASCDLARAFKPRDKPTDIPYARRDWVFLPEGDVVTIDRASTTGPARAMHLRFRSPARLTLGDAGAVPAATGDLGASRLAIHVVALSGGTPAIRSIPIGDCDQGPAGACTAARIPVDEYGLDVPGPEALAVHVIDARGTDEPPALVARLDVRAGDGGGGDLVGAAVRRGARVSYVLAGATPGAAASSRLSYTVPGDLGARHLIFDAPEDADGRASVEATPESGGCRITIEPGGAKAFAGRPLIFEVAAAAAGCQVAFLPTVTDDDGRAAFGGPYPRSAFPADGWRARLRHLPHPKRIVAVILLGIGAVLFRMLGRRRTGVR